MEAKHVSTDDAALSEVYALYGAAAEAMRARGLSEWQWEVYPSSGIIAEDAEAGRLFAISDESGLWAAFALCGEPEPEYAGISWRYGVKPAMLHRLAIAPERFREEAIALALSLAREKALKQGFDSLRLDACREDARMLGVLGREAESEAIDTRDALDNRNAAETRHAFEARNAGVVSAESPRLDAICFETPLSPLTPMLPIKMRPVYRAGTLTPWGGEGLRTRYNKDIPDPRTGEALEVSAIKGLESVSDTGETLTDMLAGDPLRLTGKPEAGEFPLLLKLLCADEPLSVQVHPDDAYARAHEGKLGKSEAWVILGADENASILYGLNEGVTTDALRDALHAGADIEPMIARVPAREGDVFYMPSGMVHAIGGGIILYEIQQSSDVTYRLWDYNRVNAKGEKRPLHIAQALDVIDPALRGLRAQLPPEGGNRTVTLLDVPAFTLECVCVDGEYALAPHHSGFRIITALKGLLLSWQGDALELEAGESALLPAACPPVTLMGVGRALVARE